MRKVIIIWSLLSFLFFGAEVFFSLPVEPVCYAQERAGINEWDFGVVKQGAVLKHDFILKNETNDILAINSIHTSCGCTASQSDKRSLMPQESTAIKVTFNSHGYSGQVKQFVYVNTDNADQAIIRFTVKANVIKED
ncbi:MAG: DUF1573 domain-containing protein [Candidatus Omnitrophica bacterium]|nr:DUF1573 domain-containing protein [Candidatus Omnitrophota bacterium]